MSVYACMWASALYRVKQRYADTTQHKQRKTQVVVLSRVWAFSGRATGRPLSGSFEWVFIPNPWNKLSPHTCSPPPSPRLCLSPPNLTAALVSLRICQGQGHKRTTRPERGDVPKAPRKLPKCSKWGVLGHMKNVCSKPIDQFEPNFLSLALSCVARVLLNSFSLHFSSCSPVYFYD